MLFSFDIKRTNIDASAASTAGVYSGFWIYYNLYGADGTTVSTTGRGFYLRTSDANFAATDSDWVHMTPTAYITSPAIIRSALLMRISVLPRRRVAPVQSSSAISKSKHQKHGQTGVLRPRTFMVFPAV